jgi:hypothetical protein
VISADYEINDSTKLNGITHSAEMLPGRFKITASMKNHENYIYEPLLALGKE